MADLVVGTTHSEGRVGSIRKTDDEVEFSIDRLLGADDLKLLTKQGVLGMGYQHPFRRFPCERGSVFRSVPAWKERSRKACVPDRYGAPDISAKRKHTSST